MTENKRYKLSNILLNNPFAIYDNGEALTQNEVINKLNEQDNEIKRLEKMNEELLTIIKGISEDSAQAIVDLWQNVVYE